MEKVVEKFEVKYLQILDEEGNIDSKLMPKLSSSQIKKMYEQMVLLRTFDDFAVKLQRQGRCGTYASSLGQEAAQIGSALAMKKEDFVFPSFREQGVYLSRGMPTETLMLFWIGDERGMQIPKNVNMFSISIPVGTHIPHAIGMAMAFKHQKKKAAVATYFGDGATSKGDFHESFNFAGTFKAPVVFICQNNQWAISVPVSEQTASETLAQKALAYGFEGIKVDGNDVFAVYKATKEAMDKARSGKGPTFIECLTYRRDHHTTSDDWKKYRSEKEVREWEKKDPIDRLKKYMARKKLLTPAYESKIKKWAEKTVSEAVKKAESVKPMEVDEIFDYTFEALPPYLEEQKKEAKEEAR